MTARLYLHAFATAAIACALAHSSQATSIIGVRTPTAVVLGGDSKLIRADGAAAGSVCKVRIVNNVAYANSGILLIPAYRFAAADTVNRSLRTDGDLSSRVSAFDEAISQQLIRIATALKRENPKFYSTGVKGKTVLAIVFATVENHVPIMMLLSYVANEQNGEITLNTTRYSCPGDCPTGTGWVTLGDSDAAQADLRANPTTFSDLGSEAAIRRLIEDEIADQPGTVGGPIDIVVIDDAGVKRSGHRGTCSQAMLSIEERKEIRVPRLCDKDRHCVYYLSFREYVT